MEADTETWGALAWGTAAAGVWGLRSSPSLRAGGCREPALGFSAGGVGGGADSPSAPSQKNDMGQRCLCCEDTACGVSPRGLPWVGAGGTPGSPLPAKPPLLSPAWLWGAGFWG